MKQICLPLLLFVVFLFPFSGHSQNPTFVEEEVSFENGEVELRGTLILPGVAAKTPAIVFLHGSGPHDRRGFRAYAEEFAKLGFSSLLFDKRGTGSSKGSWITSSLRDLANDAVSAVQYLKTREEVDPKRIGFWGISQAGWVAPYAAAISNDIAFMILVSGGGASPYESELHSYKQWFSAMNFSEAEKVNGLNLIEDYMNYLAKGSNRELIAAKLDTVSNKNLIMLSKQLSNILPSEENRSNWEWVANYDPGQHINQLKIPTLILAGDKDNNHPSFFANERWSEGFSDNPELLTTVLFPGAGHGIRIGSHHSEGQAFAEGYWEVQLGWLWKNVK